MPHPPLLPSGRARPPAPRSCLASTLHFALRYVRPVFAVRLGEPAMLSHALHSTLTDFYPRVDHPPSRLVRGPAAPLPEVPQLPIRPFLVARTPLPRVRVEPVEAADCPPLVQSRLDTFYRQWHVYPPRLPRKTLVLMGNCSPKMISNGGSTWADGRLPGGSHGFSRRWRRTGFALLTWLQCAGPHPPTRLPVPMRLVLPESAWRRPFRRGPNSGRLSLPLPLAIFLRGC